MRFSKKTLLFFLIIIILISFWIIVLSSNFKYNKNNFKKQGLSFDELRNEVNTILQKSPLVQNGIPNLKPPTSTDNSELKSVAEKLAEELKNTETLNQLNTNTPENIK
jgi:cytoskeletal protein RodZ